MPRSPWSDAVRNLTDDVFSPTIGSVSATAPVPQPPLHSVRQTVPVGAGTEAVPQEVSSPVPRRARRASGTPRVRDICVGTRRAPSSNHEIGSEPTPVAHTACNEVVAVATNGTMRGPIG
jgi:hypothetical protein